MNIQALRERAQNIPLNSSSDLSLLNHPQFNNALALYKSQQLKTHDDVINYLNNIKTRKDGKINASNWNLKRIINLDNKAYLNKYVNRGFFDNKKNYNTQKYLNELIPHLSYSDAHALRKELKNIKNDDLLNNYKNSEEFKRLTNIIKKYNAGDKTINEDEAEFAQHEIDKRIENILKIPPRLVFDIVQRYYKKYFKIVESGNDVYNDMMKGLTKLKNKTVSKYSIDSKNYDYNNNEFYIYFINFLTNNFHQIFTEGQKILLKYVTNKTKGYITLSNNMILRLKELLTKNDINYF
jgi:hypothetical protein